MVAALACLCCLLGYCLLICCPSGDREEEDAREEEDVREEEAAREEKSANVQNVFATRRCEVKEENVKDEKPFLPPQTQTRSFLAKVVPSFSVLKPVMRPLRPFFAKIRTIRPPPLLQQQTTNGMTRPMQFVQTTAVAPILMMQPQSQAMVRTSFFF